MGARSLTRCPSICSSPEVMSSSPTIIRRVVDLPQPDGPTKIMNSPSAMSRLMSLTALKPSPYSLTMCLRVMLAITVCSPSRGSALDGTRGEAGDDAALEDEDENDHGHRHHDARGADSAGGRLKLAGAGEEG